MKTKSIATTGSFFIILEMESVFFELSIDELSYAFVCGLCEAVSCESLFDNLVGYL
jgi:hypothetical protein